MRVLIDTNILISAAYSRGSVPHLAYIKAVDAPYQALICEQSLEELRHVFNRKFPDKVHVFESFVAAALSAVEIVPVPPLPHPNESQIRDINDHPILRAAIHYGADILLTGDKDFLESSVTNPKIMTAAAFLRELR
jgi:putative PIN family toxin of toxin-antitoxin system